MLPKSGYNFKETTIAHWSVPMLKRPSDNLIDGCCAELGTVECMHVPTHTSIHSTSTHVYTHTCTHVYTYLYKGLNTCRYTCLYKCRCICLYTCLGLIGWGVLRVRHEDGSQVRAPDLSPCTRLYTRLYTCLYIRLHTCLHT